MQLGKKGLFPLTICSQSFKEVRAGTLRQELKHKPCGTLLAGLLSLLFYILKAHLLLAPCMVVLLWTELFCSIYQVSRKCSTTLPTAQSDGSFLK